MTFYPGQLLVSSPTLADPNFYRSVVLLLDHDEDGALGVVINRPSEIPLHAVLPPWAEAVSEPQLLFSGGPVSPESALAVGLQASPGPAEGFKRLAGGFGLVDLDAEPEAVIKGLVGVRVFSGYAGWSAEQLEDEINEGSWYIVAPIATDVLNARPEQLWRAVLRRQPGETAYLSTYPDDPTMN